jgi:hypothetical protein
VTASTDVVYAIAGALQKKFKDHVVAVASECIGKDNRMLFSFKLRAVDQIAETAYSEGFFESKDPAQINWLAKRVYEELNQRIAWKRKAAPKDRNGTQYADKAINP